MRMLSMLLLVHSPPEIEKMVEMPKKRLGELYLAKSGQLPPDPEYFCLA
jgi:hypothetical protein